MERFDPGLQPERTLLAWRRTLLALGVAGLVGLRLLPASLGAWSLPIPLIVIALAIALHFTSERRFRQTYAALISEVPIPTAGPIALTVALVVAVSAVSAIICVIYLSQAGPADSLDLGRPLDR